MRDQEIVGLYEAYQSIYSNVNEEVEQLDELKLDTMLSAREERKKRIDADIEAGNVSKAKAGMRKQDRTKRLIRNRRNPDSVAGTPHFPSGSTAYRKEEVEIAAQYFYEMGLNETGIEILIEELGVEEFAEWVYDIADSYVLNERKLASGETALPARTREKIGGSRAASRAFSDPTKKTTAGGKRRAARAAAREEGETRETPRQARIRELRAKAATKAQKKQPQKQGFLGRIAGAVSAGIERDKKARENLGRAAQETGKVIGKAAKLAGGVAGEVVKGAGGAAGIMGHLARKGLKEEVETWVNSLVEEGYDLSDYTWDDMYEMYMNLDEEAPQRIQLEPSPKVKPHAGPARLHNPTKRKKVKKVIKETNLFNYLLEYLVAEGYADTNKAAINIMSHMSEEWKQSIVEEVLKEGRTTNLRALGRESQQRKADKERGRPETEDEIHRRLRLGRYAPSQYNYKKGPDGKWTNMGRKDGEKD